MKLPLRLVPVCLLVSSCWFPSAALAQGTAFTYQGQLVYGGAPYSGPSEMQFTLWDAPSGGTVLMTNTPAIASVNLSNGLFTIALDFGAAAFPGADRWLEIQVRTTLGPFTTLSPRQALTPTPYALTAANVVSGGLPAGTYSNALTLNNSSNSITGAFTGNGAAVSNVNAATLGGLGIANFWQLSGNSLAPGQFLGSLNNEAVELWAGGYRVLRLEPDAGGSFAGNLIGGYTNNLIESTNTGGDVIAGGGYGGGINAIRANSRGDFIGAGSANQIGPNVNDAVIGGGYGNTVAASDALIGGGYFNAVPPGGFYSLVVGGAANTNQGYISGIGSGERNYIHYAADHSAIGGGGFNTIAGSPGPVYGTVGGGYFNSIQTNAAYATIGGGALNTIQSNALAAAIGGGYQHTVQAGTRYPTIAGGYLNTIETGNFDSIGGGYNNRIQSLAHDAVIAGGFNNLIGTNAQGSTIVGGEYNLISNRSSESFIGGGYLNVIQTNLGFATIAGGDENSIGAGASSSTIGGGGRNRIAPSASFGTIAGGGGNNCTDYACTVGGGGNNLSGGFYSFVGGGLRNLASNYYATVVAGEANTNFGPDCFIGGGFNNFIATNNGFSVIAGGAANQIHTRAGSSFIGGGEFNIIGTNSDHSVIPGGYGNSVTGRYSLAAGFRAKAIHPGTFVWGDSQSADFSSTAPNQFLIRAAGGVGLGTAAPVGQLHVRGQDGAQLRLENSANSSYWSLYSESFNNSGYLLFVAASGSFVYFDTAGFVHGASDQRLKRDIAPLGSVLDRVLQLRPVSYRMKSAPADAPRALGLIAQEVEPLFPEVVGGHAGMKSLAYTELVPVALRAVQELNQKVESENAALRAENAALRRRHDSLEHRLEALERVLLSHSAQE